MIRVGTNSPPGEAREIYLLRRGRYIYVVCYWRDGTGHPMIMIPFQATTLREILEWASGSDQNCPAWIPDAICKSIVLSSLGATA